MIDLHVEGLKGAQLAGEQQIVEGYKELATIRLRVGDSPMADISGTYR